MVVINNLVKKYGKFTAVDNLSLNIEKGQIYGFVGANGAGKTTTMRIISGLLRPTSGEVRVNGVDIIHNPGGYKKHIGYMPDFFGVYDDLKVTEYMNFYSGIYKIENSKRAAITDKLLELVNLSDKKDFYVDALSRGMKQRLCLARSLIHDPQLLILDEPASGLDPKARIEMKQILRTLKDLGKTILISSHILPELSELCTAIGIIERGKMVITGTVEEILNQLSHNKKFKLKVIDKAETARRLLEENPTVSSVQAADNILKFSFSGDEGAAAELLKEMVVQDIPVLSFVEEESNLESIFMHIASGGIENAG